MINVTKTFLPDKNKFKQYVDIIYENGWITNYGPLVKELEKRLAAYLGIEEIVLVSNGTIALEIAYRMLDLKGSVVTTPFSFVATTSSLVTNGLRPIFADISPMSFNLSPEEIERHIEDDTSAILPVHVYGNACEIDEIAAIADKRNLKVVYDAAHAFGVKYKDRSILSYGDVSTISFHATKIFHSIEGGAIVAKDRELAKKARYLINFGIANEESIPHIGTNGKMNEFQAAMGLCMLDEMEEIFKKRNFLYNRYIEGLGGCLFIPERNADADNNFSYFPVLCKTHEEMRNVQKALNDNGIFPRRYFYPSLDTLGYLENKEAMPVSNSISERVLCLPLYPELSTSDQDNIISIVRSRFEKI